MAGFAVRVPTRVSSRSSEDHDSNYGSSMAFEPEPSYDPEPSELFCRPAVSELEPLSKPVPFVKLNFDESSMLYDSTYVPETPSYCESDDLSYESRAGGTKHSHPLSHNHAPGTVGSSPYISFEPWEGFPLFHGAHVPDASKAIPKYLFRMWTPRGGLVPHHQSTSGIIPSGHKEGKGHQSMYDMNISDFKTMIMMHVCKDEQEGSEFTSWTSSFHFALAYATTKRDTANIAVIDTGKLQKTNTVLMLQSLLGHFPWEYLVHGIIENTPSKTAYACVPFKTMTEAGLSKWCPSYNKLRNAWVDMFRLSDTRVRKLTVGEVDGLKRIAAGFGKSFALIITISLICVTRRSDTFWKDITEEEAKIVIRAMHTEEMPKDSEWTGSNGIINDVYDYRFEDNKQMVQLIRKILSLYWGKGARTMRKTLEQQMEDLTVSNGTPISKCWTVGWLHSSVALLGIGLVGWLFRVR